MDFGMKEAKMWLVQLNEQLQKQKGYLTELDQNIGDGDHGLNMSRGFKEVIKIIEPTTYNDLGSLFQDVGKTLLFKVGGASGPLYGTVFLRIATSLKNKQEIGKTEIENALQSALEGIKVRGKANLGDKTMVDVWEPILHYLQTKKEDSNWDEVILLAKEKMEQTKEIEAKKGRAAYLGKRSIGHIDPGAASSCYFFVTLATIFKGVEEN